MTVDSSPSVLPVTDEDVAAYLIQNPKFFVDKTALLADMTLPHQRGEAISLVERQVSLLRERNKDMHERLNNLLDNARINDQLFEKTKRLILHLLEAQDINDFVSALTSSFKDDFGIPYMVLMLFSEQETLEGLNSEGDVMLVTLEQAKGSLGTIISNNQTVCGQLAPAEQSFVFNTESEYIGSTAITPLGGTQSLGLLAIGNPDPDYYRSSMSTLFLSYIGEVINRLLPKHL